MPFIRRVATATTALSLFVVVGATSGCRGRSPFLAYIDASGRIRIRLEPGQSARSFSEGLAAVSVNGRWGYINPGGTFVIQPQFGWAEDFSEGLALVTSRPADQYWKKDTLFGFINTSGEYVIAPRFNWALSFSEGLAPVCIGLCRNEDLSQARIGYIDHKGNYVLPARYGSGGAFSEGLASASAYSGIGPPVGFINKSGRFVIEPRYRWTHDFSGGLAATDQGFVNHAGDVVIAKQSASMWGDFSGGWAPILENRRIVYVDTTGKIILKTQYEAAGPFAEDLAPACASNCGPSGSGRNWGYINKGGQFAIKPRFDYKPKPFKNGLALVCFGCMG
jgi:WG containing repeat